MPGRCAAAREPTRACPARRRSRCPQVACVVGDTVFVHAGLVQEHLRFMEIGLRVPDGKDDSHVVGGGSGSATAATKDRQRAQAPAAAAANGKEGEEEEEEGERPPTEALWAAALQEAGGCAGTAALVALNYLSAEVTCGHAHWNAVCAAADGAA